MFQRSTPCRGWGLPGLQPNTGANLSQIKGYTQGFTAHRRPFSDLVTLAPAGSDSGAAPEAPSHGEPLRMSVSPRYSPKRERAPLPTGDIAVSRVPCRKRTQPYHSGAVPLKNKKQHQRARKRPIAPRDIRERPMSLQELRRWASRRCPCVGPREVGGRHFTDGCYGQEGLAYYPCLSGDARA